MDFCNRLRHQNCRHRYLIWIVSNRCRSKFFLQLICLSSSNQIRCIRKHNWNSLIKKHSLWNTITRFRLLFKSLMNDTSRYIEKFSTNWNSGASNRLREDLEATVNYANNILHWWTSRTRRHTNATSQDVNKYVLSLTQKSQNWHWISLERYNIGPLFNTDATIELKKLPDAKQTNDGLSRRPWLSANCLSKIT